MESRVTSRCSVQVAHSAIGKCLHFLVVLPGIVHALSLREGLLHLLRGTVCPVSLVPVVRGAGSEWGQGQPYLQGRAGEIRAQGGSD